jgi:tetratricopeptide (TPR) repeat protein
LAKNLLEEKISGLAKDILGCVEDKGTFEFLQCQAEIYSLQKQHHEAIQCYHTLSEMDAKWIQAYINCGHEFLYLRSNQEALNQYLKAIRIANLSGQELQDPLLFQRAG